MSFDDTNNVDVGEYTKKSHYDQLLANTVALNAALTGALIYSSTQSLSSDYTVTTSWADVDNGGSDKLVTGTLSAGAYFVSATLICKIEDITDTDGLELRVRFGASNALVTDRLGFSAGSSLYALFSITNYRVSLASSGTIAIQAIESGPTGDPIIYAPSAMTIFSTFEGL